MNELKQIENPEHYLNIKSIKQTEYKKRLRDILKIMKNKLSARLYSELFNHKLQCLQKKFNEVSYIQAACELTVVGYFAKNYSSSFVYEKKVSPPKDVDCTISIDNVNYNIEVKCVDNTKYMSSKHDDSKIEFTTYGRYPDRESYDEVLKEHRDRIQDILEENPDKELFEVANRDLKLKDFLVSAQEKFHGETNGINILFICVGDLEDVRHWTGYLYGNEGVLTEESFLEYSEFDNVDVIVISNLYHRHSKYYEKPHLSNIWKLERAYNILYPNKYSKNKRKDKNALLSVLFDDTFHQTIEYADVTDSRSSVKPFGHDMYVNSVLKQRGDIRF